MGLQCLGNGQHRFGIRRRASLCRLGGTYSRLVSLTLTVKSESGWSADCWKIIMKLLTGNHRTELIYSFSICFFQLLTFSYFSLMVNISF